MGLFLALLLLLVCLLGLRSLDLLIGLDGVGFLVPGLPFGVHFELVFVELLLLKILFLDVGLMPLNLIFPLGLSLGLLPLPDKFAPLPQLFFVLDSLLLLFLPIRSPFSLLPRLLDPLSLDPLFPVFLCLFAPDSLLFDPRLSDLLPPDALVLSRLLDSLILEPSRLCGFMPLPLLLLIPSLPYIFLSPGCLNLNALPLFFLESTLLDFL